MIVSDLKLDESRPGGWELSATVTFENGAAERHRVWFRDDSGAPPPPMSADPFFAGLVVPSMYLKEPLRLEGAVSPELVRAFTEGVEPILLRWFPFFAPSRTSADAELHFDASGAARGTASTFSGGLDSLYTFLKNRASLTHVLVAAGFDCAQYHPSFYPSVIENVRRQAARHGKEVLAVASNLTQVGNGIVLRRARRLKLTPFAFFHPRSYFNSELVAFGLLYRPVIGRLLIANTHPAERVRGSASNPLCDPRWSTPGLEIVHDGAEVDRTGKAEAIARWSVEDFDTLRVCHNAGSRGANCGVCEKCLRTMASLRLVGALDRCKAFDRPLDLDLIARMRWPNGLIYWSDLREAALERGDPALAHAAEAQLGERLHPGRMRDGARLAYLEFRRGRLGRRLRRSLRDSIRRRRQYVLARI